MFTMDISPLIPFSIVILVLGVIVVICAVVLAFFVAITIASIAISVLATVTCALASSTMPFIIRTIISIRCVRIVLVVSIATTNIMARSLLISAASIIVRSRGLDGHQRMFLVHCRWAIRCYHRSLLHHGCHYPIAALPTTAALIFGGVILVGVAPVIAVVLAGVRAIVIRVPTAALCTSRKAARRAWSSPCSCSTECTLVHALRSLMPLCTYASQW